MKIPSSIRIAGIDYTIGEEKKVLLDSKEVYGFIDYGASQILLSAESQCHQCKCVTLLHEMLHAIAKHSSLDLGKNEEQIIDVFAHGLYQILQDNGQKLFDLKEQEESKPND